MPDDPNMQGSLLDDDDSAASIGAVRTRASLMERSRLLQAALTARCGAAWAKPLSRYAIMGACSVGALGLGLGIYLTIRPVP